MDRLEELYVQYCDVDAKQNAEDNQHPETIRQFKYYCKRIFATIAEKERKQWNRVAVLKWNRVQGAWSKKASHTEHLGIIARAFLKADIVSEQDVVKWTK